MKKIIIVLGVLMLVASFAFGDGIYVDEYGNMWTGVQTYYGWSNIEVLAGPGEYAIVGDGNGGTGGGVYGLHSEFGNYGILGRSDAGVYGVGWTPGYAGKFMGNVLVSGNLTVNGTFTANETDPQVETLTSGKWCTSDGTAVNCTSNEPVLTEVDTVFTGSPAFGITSGQITNWGTAYGWGDHSGVGYDATNDSWTGTGDVYTTSGNVAIGTSSSEFKLTVSGDGGILATGTYGSGALLTTSGPGTRLIWYPRKAAFRAGRVSGDQWDDSNIKNFSAAFGSGKASGVSSTAMGGGTASGNSSTAMGGGTANGSYSTAMGNLTTAGGDYSTAMGNSTTASNSMSTAMGWQTTASGNSSTAMGRGSTAGQTASTAMGYYTTASGMASTAMGDNTTAQAYGSTVLGEYNIVSGDPLTPVATDPLFVIGNGTSSIPANALTVLRNGKAGFGLADPSKTLYVQENSPGISYALKLENKYPSSSGEGTGILFSAGGSGTNDRGKGALVYEVTDTWNRGNFHFLQEPNGNSSNPTLANKVMTISSDGYVGIGATDPTHKLHVSGGSDTYLGYFSNSNDTSNSASGLLGQGIVLQATGTGTGGVFYGYGGSTYGSGYGSRHYASANGSAEAFGVYSDATYGSTTGREWAFYGIGDSYFSGDVGIGTDTPAGTLDVNGPIYQRGELLYSDYVFEPDYNLESIEEHADFMWTNKHLKAIPKAKVDESGREIVEVGSHRRGIVEELEKAHIYIEQLYKENAGLQEKVELLEYQQKAIEEMKNRLARLEEKQSPNEAKPR